jgi:restriction system protein
VASGVKCLSCGHEVPASRVMCPYCGTRLPAYLREMVAAAKEAERVEKDAQRREAVRLVNEGVGEAARRNAGLAQTLAGLSSLLSATLAVDDYVDFESLKDSTDLPEFDPGPLGMPLARPSHETPELQLPPPLTAVHRLVPGAKKRHEEQVAAQEFAHQHAVAEAEAAHAQALRRHEEAERDRETKLAKARAEHEEAVKLLREEVAQQHERVDALKKRFDDSQPEAVSAYFDHVLKRSAYPAGFPKGYRLAFVPESKQLVVEYELPAFDIVPAVASYKYVKASGTITESWAPLGQRKALYASVVAQTAIRTLHELFEADRTEKLETVAFNGWVNAIDKATGKAIRPHLITVRSTRDAFQELDLSRVDPLACLKALNASVSKSPAELVPVRPIVDFNMVDPRFVQEADVLSTLDQRPNLMELTPGEFEALITNLFEKMGLETRLTQASRDGGVDCVAYDPRPIFGGKVVIQAKRYKNTVGVSAVRDLFGTMQNEGASKGILVTTSGYGKASFDFADGKPMELLSGSNLLYLLAEYAGLEAKIEVPEDWVDPEPDS